MLSVENRSNAGGHWHRFRVAGHGSRLSDVVAQRTPQKGRTSGGQADEDRHHEQELLGAAGREDPVGPAVELWRLVVPAVPVLLPRRERRQVGILAVEAPG